MASQIPIEDYATGESLQISSEHGLDQHNLSGGTLIFEDSGENPDDASPVFPEPPLRIESLHAMKYCERLFYFQEVEQISVAHPDVYAGRRLHDDVVPEDDITPEKPSFQVESETWGLIGKADAVRKRDGFWVAYEHKKGRCRRGDDKSPLPWPSDRIQAIAYSVLIEETLGEPVREARIRYHTGTAFVFVSRNSRAMVLHGREVYGGNAIGVRSSSPADSSVRGIVRFKAVHRTGSNDNSGQSGIAAALSDAGDAPQ